MTGRFSAWRGTEPALIHPGLKLATDPTAIGYATAGYWPSYSDVSPAFRAKYLRWLAGRVEALGGTVTRMALAARPRLVLLDEVLCGLTPTEIQSACELIKRIRDQGTTIVFVEHVMDAVMALTDRIVVFDPLADTTVPRSGTNALTGTRLTAEFGRYSDGSGEQHRWTLRHVRTPQRIGARWLDQIRRKGNISRVHWPGRSDR